MRHHPIYIYNNHYDKKRRELLFSKGKKKQKKNKVKVREKCKVKSVKVRLKYYPKKHYILNG